MCSQRKHFTPNRFTECMNLTWQTCWVNVETSCLNGINILAQPIFDYCYYQWIARLKVKWWNPVNLWTNQNQTESGGSKTGGHILMGTQIELWLVSMASAKFNLQSVTHRAAIQLQKHVMMVVTDDLFLCSRGTPFFFWNKQRMVCLLHERQTSETLSSQ